MSQINWNSNVETTDFGGLKDGQYTFRIVGAECKVPKSNLGEMLSLELDVAGGGKHYENWCYVHENEIVADIANQNIKRLQSALGMAQLTDTDQLIGKMFTAKMRTKGDFQNMLNIAAANATGSTQAPATPAPTANDDFGDKMPDFMGG